MAFILVVLSLLLFKAVNALVSSSSCHSKIWTTAVVDYSAATEYIAEHYHIVNYFGDKNTAQRIEPIWNAREGVNQKDHKGNVVIPLESMKRCGFALMEAPSAVQDFEDIQQIQTIYQEELKQIIPRALDMDPKHIEAIFFWHPMLRGETMIPQVRSQSQPAQANVASMVHMDTDVGAYGLNGILDLVANNVLDSESLMDLQKIRKHIETDKRRFIMLNTWRPLVPVNSMPLALYATRYKELNGMFPQHRPCLDKSRWYIFPNMQPSECLLFKQYDRRLDQACDIWHTSVEIPSEKYLSEPRKSFDIKAMVILKESVPPTLDRLRVATAPKLSWIQSENFCSEQARKRRLSTSSPRTPEAFP